MWQKGLEEQDRSTVASSGDDGVSDTRVGTNGW